MRWAGAALFGIFLCVTLFGLPILLSHGGHHIGCPLQMAGEVMCESTIIDHFSIWQTMFASIVSALAVCAFVVLVIVRAEGVLIAHERIRLRFSMLVNERPPLLQELFSRGILNRKEPYSLS